MKNIEIALVMGDGSAPEMMRVACKIAKIAAVIDGINIQFIKTPMGWGAYQKYGDTLPKKSLEKAMEIGIVFFGAVGDPALDNTIGVEKPEMKPETKVLLALRSQMGLLLNFRPVVYYKELAHLAQVRPERIPEQGIRQIWLRFLLQDSYFGSEDLREQIPPEVRERIGLWRKNVVTGDQLIVSDIAYYTRKVVEKYFRAAFSHARLMKLPLIVIDKANIMARYVFWRKIAERIGKKEFPDVPLSFQYVDAANALLFDPVKLQGVIACGNEHGDILSDGAVAAMGSMGLMCSSAINPDNGKAMFEAGSGTAPTLAGKNIANPLGRILTAAMMLRHIGAPKGAGAIETAVREVLSNGSRTADLFSAKRGDADSIGLGTKEIGELVLDRVLRQR
ncbi:hypothetical protein KKB43_04300 [Patescibacteria group bacterium]|nr:hypothetical protein [Patescibacteria group bacterium]MBU4580210.1 hypothetical protein [Patescibacteria group bacterium]